MQNITEVPNTNQPKISIIVIHYNSPKFLPLCLNSIFAQTYKNIEVIFIDNGSTEKYNFSERENLKIIQNTENFGYAKAANQGIRMSNSPYVAIVNPDIIFTETYFEKIVESIEKNSSVASITGKIYYFDFEKQLQTKIIDTTGIEALRNRRFLDRGQGEIDEGQFEEECGVFGASGACPLYRREALEDVKVFDEYFDEDFFMYKEDVDLAWRLTLYGWKNLYCPLAIAYHGRGTGISTKYSTKQALKNRKNLTIFQKKHSFTNQHLMQVKNELPQTFLTDFFPIMMQKIFTPVYITFFEPYLWGSYGRYLKKLPNALRKRKVIMKNKKVSAKEMRKWFKKKTSTVSR